MFDVIVVGARCAGSPLAMLLARKGHSVLVVDRARFPSDTLSTHFMTPDAVERLRALELPSAVKATVQQSSFESIFVDMMESVQRDGPRATAMSLALVIGLLLLAFGPGRYFLATGLALLGGLFGMLGLMALFGVRLNFLNFVALPITIGIGVDYPFNVVARLRLELRAGTRGAELLRAVLRSAGAVTLCSATTTIGYAVLLSSDTGAIRSFGMAAILGEFTTLLGALLLVPLLVTFAAERHR